MTYFDELSRNTIGDICKYASPKITIEFEKLGTRDNKPMFIMGVGMAAADVVMYFTVSFIFKDDNYLYCYFYENANNKIFSLNDECLEPYHPHVICKIPKRLYEKKFLEFIEKEGIVIMRDENGCFKIIFD